MAHVCRHTWRRFGLFFVRVLPHLSEWVGEGVGGSEGAVAGTPATMTPMMAPEALELKQAVANTHAIDLISGCVIQYDRRCGMHSLPSPALGCSAKGLREWVWEGGVGGRLLPVRQPPRYC